MIHLLKEKTTPTQMQEMLQEYKSMVKFVVDIRLHTLAGGGEMHADCETVLLEAGSEQDDLWGANWYQDEQRVEFESLINIRPRLGNRNTLIQNKKVRRQVDAIAHKILGGVR